jgi:hypothetical protein
MDINSKTNHTTPKKHPQRTQNTQKAKTKRATFTYSGPETPTITNLFTNTNIEIAYKTTNTIRHLVKHKNPLANTVKPLYNGHARDRKKCPQ